jgi:hypothetical protein
VPASFFPGRNVRTSSGVSLQRRRAIHSPSAGLTTLHSGRRWREKRSRSFGVCESGPPDGRDSEGSGQTNRREPRMTGSPSDFLWEHLSAPGDGYYRGRDVFRTTRDFSVHRGNRRDLRVVRGVGALGSHLDRLSSFFPGGAIEIVGGQPKRVAAGGKTTLSFAFFISLALSLWSANAGMKALFDALNIVGCGFRRWLFWPARKSMQFWSAWIAVAPNSSLNGHRRTERSSPSVQILFATLSVDTSSNSSVPRPVTSNSQI